MLGRCSEVVIMAAIEHILHGDSCHVAFRPSLTFTGIRIHAAKRSFPEAW